MEYLFDVNTLFLDTNSLKIQLNILKCLSKPKSNLKCALKSRNTARIIQKMHHKVPILIKLFTPKKYTIFLKVRLQTPPRYTMIHRLENALIGNARAKMEFQE